MSAPRNGRKRPFRASRCCSLEKPRQTDRRGGDETGFTAIYASSATPSFRASGCYLCLNVIIVFPPARVLPSGKTRITHLARIERPARFVGRTYGTLHNERCLNMSVLPKNPNMSFNKEILSTLPSAAVLPIFGKLRTNV